MGSQFINVTFHGIGPHPRPLPDVEREVWIEDVDEFGAMLDSLSGCPDVRITFDDGNASDVDIALPALTRRGLSATFFVLPGLLGERGFLTEQGVLTLRRQRMLIGSHGMFHRAWRHLSDRDLQEELVAARTMLEDVTGGPVRTAACPFGSYDRRTLKRLRMADYGSVFTSDGGWASNTWLQPRNTIRDSDDAASVARLVGHRPSASARAVFAAKRQVKQWR